MDLRALQSRSITLAARRAGRLDLLAVRVIWRNAHQPAAAALHELGSGGIVSPHCVPYRHPLLVSRLALAEPVESEALQAVLPGQDRRERLPYERPSDMIGLMIDPLLAHLHQCGIAAPPGP